MTEGEHTSQDGPTGTLSPIIKTIHNVLCQEDVAVDTDTAEQYLDEERKSKA